MSSVPKCLQNPGLRQVKLRSGRTVITEKTGQQRYLVWSDGKPLTEVEQMPKDSGRWYWRGAMACQYALTMRDAIQNGIGERRFGNRPIPDSAWSAPARAAIAKNQN